MYTLRYETNGGSAVAASAHDRGTTVALTAAPARAVCAFDGDADITREQFATILYRYVKLNGGGFEGDDTGSLRPGDSNLLPDGDTTREQMAALLHRFEEKVK